MEMPRPLNRDLVPERQHQHRGGWHHRRTSLHRHRMNLHLQLIREGASQAGRAGSTTCRTASISPTEQVTSFAQTTTRAHVQMQIKAFGADTLVIQCISVSDVWALTQPTSARMQRCLSLGFSRG